MAFDEQAGCGAAVRNGSRVKERLARNNFLGRMHVGNDFFSRQLGAGAQPSHCRGGSHQLQRVATIDATNSSGICGELVLEEIAIVLRLRQLLEALPEALVASFGTARAPQRSRSSSSGQALDSLARFHSSVARGAALQIFQRQNLVLRRQIFAHGGLICERCSVLNLTGCSCDGG